jgi:hypothetical protein
MEALILVVTLPDNVCADWCHESSEARVFRHVPQGSSMGTAEADEGPLILRQRVAETKSSFHRLMFKYSSGRGGVGHPFIRRVHSCRHAQAM